MRGFDVEAHDRCRCPARHHDGSGHINTPNTKKETSGSLKLISQQRLVVEQAEHSRDDY
jgi:hypothetical protein